jgi:pyruvate,water dikinase
VGASGAAGATYRALEVLLERWLPDHHAASWAQRITRGALGASAIGAARSRQLEQILGDHGTAEIREVIASIDAEPRSALVALGPTGRRFLSVLDTAVRIMGSTSLYGGTTWSEDETWIWRQLEYLIDETRRVPVSTASATDDFGELCHHLTGDKRWRNIRILTGQFIDLRVRWLRRQLDETIRFLEQRERAKNALLVLGGEERRLIVEASHRLVESRQMADPDLVQYLTDDELEGMLFGHCGIDGSELTRRRNLAMAYTAQDPLPDWFAGDPDLRSPTATPGGDRFEGWAAGPGYASGPVRVISSLAEGTRLERGDVLVAHSTDPSWTPLFLLAGAIVLETGGPLSHAAIVAREFGLPAVLNIPHATRVLSEGEFVFVDGTLGLVERVDPGGLQ